MFTILTALYGTPAKAEAALCSSEGFPPLVDAIAGVVMIIIGATIASGTLAPGSTYALVALGSLELAPLLHHVLSTLRDSCRKKAEASKPKLSPPVKPLPPPETETQKKVLVLEPSAGTILNQILTEEGLD